MDSLDLLAREDEFKKLNKQLEKKTESLIKQIEHAMQKQDIFSEFSPNLTLSPVHTTKKHNCDTQRPVTPPQTQQKQQKKKTKQNSTKFEIGSTSSDRSSIANKNVPTTSGKFENRTGNNSEKFENGNEEVSSGEEMNTEVNRSRIVCDCCINRSHSKEKEFLYAFVTINVKNKVLPQSFLKDRPTVESVCKFLSSKVQLMQEQIEKYQHTLDKKASQCDSHLTQLAELESERMTLLNKCNNMKASTADMKAKYMALQRRLEEKDKQYIEQRSISDKLSSEVKHLRSKTASLEGKCASHNDTVQHLTQQLDAVKRAEKEKDKQYIEQRSISDKLSSEVKHLRSKTASLEGKCASHNDTVQHLTQQLDAVKRAEKEFRDSTRSLSASHQSAISTLESQLKAQVYRIDKQMALIDNLRRQNVLLSTDAAVKSLEKQYCEYLERDF